MNPIRIAFGLTNTLVDIEEVGYDFSLKLRPGSVELIQLLKSQGHILILWTGKKRKSFDSIKRKATEFFNFFDEVYCKEDFELLEDIPGCSPHLFKNISKISADCLIESKQAYKKFSNNLQMGDKYCIIPQYREFLYSEPTKWQIRVVGPGIIEKREKRRQERENWTFEVLDFLESIKSKSTESASENDQLLGPG